MGTHIETITVDCADPFALAAFWCALLGYAADPDHPNLPGEDEAWIRDPDRRGPDLLFITVPEGKTVKNRVHLDLIADEGREAGVERALALGATLVADRREPDGSGWVVLADPEGNELCICRNATEKGRPAGADTGLRTFPPIRTAGERDQLEHMLDWYRTGVERKVTGLVQHLAVAVPLGSATSVAGLVKHLALVEDSWFAVRFAGLPAAAWYADVDWDTDPDWEFHSAADEPLELQLDRYRTACDRSRQVAAAAGLDDEARNPQGEPFVLRFILVHLLEETARHLGHLDLLRELLDGTTGE